MISQLEAEPRAAEKLYEPLSHAGPPMAPAEAALQDRGVLQASLLARQQQGASHVDPSLQPSNVCLSALFAFVLALFVFRRARSLQNPRWDHQEPLMSM